MLVLFIYSRFKSSLLLLVMEYLAYLQKDKKLAAIIKEPKPPLQMHKNIPLRLMASIMSQQLNTKVAKVLFKRFLDLFEVEESTPQQVINTSPEVLRSIGLSNAKVSYVINVAGFCIDHDITDY